jgi:hypothetical protein
MNLRSQRQSIAVPAGCAIFWSPYLLHGTNASPASSGVTFGSMYLAYITDIDRPGYEDGQERQDRRDSFTQGHAPRMFPSLDRVHYFPTSGSSPPGIRWDRKGYNRIGWDMIGY